MRFQVLVVFTDSGENVSYWVANVSTKKIIGKYSSRLEAEAVRDRELIMDKYKEIV